MIGRRKFGVFCRGALVGKAVVGAQRPLHVGDGASGLGIEIRLIGARPAQVASGNRRSPPSPDRHAAKESVRAAPLRVSVLMSRFLRFILPPLVVPAGRGLRLQLSIHIPSVNRIVEEFCIGAPHRSGRDVKVF